MDKRQKINLVKEFFKVIIIVHLVFLGIILVFSLLYSFLNPPFSTLRLYRAWVNKYHNKPVKYIPLKRIPPEIRMMVLEVEDGNFYKHIGIDVSAIYDAIQVNRKLHRKFFGGSTITQQLARTLFLVPEKSFFRKYLEALIAIEMDLVIKKDRVFQLHRQTPSNGVREYSGLSRLPITITKKASAS